MQRWLTLYCILSPQSYLKGFQSGAGSLSATLFVYCIPTASLVPPHATGFYLVDILLFQSRRTFFPRSRFLPNVKCVIKINSQNLDGENVQRNTSWGEYHGSEILNLRNDFWVLRSRVRRLIWGILSDGGRVCVQILELWKHIIHPFIHPSIHHFISHLSTVGGNQSSGLKSFKL